LLDEGAKTIEQLCAQAGTSARGLHAILNAAHGRTATSENHQLPACLARAASSLLMWSSTIL
jgi:hypothetical protein